MDRMQRNPKQDEAAQQAQGRGAKSKDKEPPPPKKAPPGAGAGGGDAAAGAGGEPQSAGAWEADETLLSAMGMGGGGEAPPADAGDAGGGNGGGEAPPAAGGDEAAAGAPVQMKRDSAEASGTPDPGKANSGGGAPLDPTVQAGMGAHFGTDFSDVRVHQGGGVDSMLEGAGARAMASGTDLYFKSGQYDPGSQGGRELIGHELAHVVQQGEGRVSGGAQGKGEGGGGGDPLEHEADAKGAAAAQTMGAIDWSTVDPAAMLAEAKRRDDAGEEVPLSKTPNQNREHPVVKDIAKKAKKGGGGAPAQMSTTWEQNHFLGSRYNRVELVDIDLLKFVEIDPDSLTKYSFGPHMNADTRGANSRRDGNFGVKHKGPDGMLEYHWDDFKTSTQWNGPVQKTIGGAGSHSISMHNWAFTDIEVEQSYDVVPGVVSVTPKEVATRLPVTDAKLPVMINGVGSVEVTASQVTKTAQGWSTGQNIANSTTVTRSMTFGLNVGLGKKDVWKVGAEGGISSSNTATVWKQIQMQSTKATGQVAATSATAKIPGDGEGKPKQMYVIPYYEVSNFDVVAYPHDADTSKVTGSPKTTPIAYWRLTGIEPMNADADGNMKPGSTPSPEVLQEEERLKKEKAETVHDVGDAKLKIALLSDEPMRKDFDRQDYLHELPPGVTTELAGEFGKDVTNSFQITDSGGTKVSSTGGWSLGVNAGAGGDGKDAAAPSVGGKVGISEMTTTAAEAGDVVAQTGSLNVSESLKTKVSVGPGTKDPDKVTQVIFTPVFRERVYAYTAFDKSKNAWETAPFKGRSREYYPIPAVTTKDIPMGSERRPEAAPSLKEDPAVQAAANDAKKLKELRDKETDPAKKAALDAKIEGLLSSQREALEEVVRKAHPSLEAVDRTKNVYRIMINVASGAAGLEQKPFVSTLEGLMDFTPPSVGAQNAAETLATKDNDADKNPTTKIESQGGLGGTGAQGGAHPHPGDVDLSEQVKITAPTADAAAQAFAASLIETIRTAEANTGPDKKLGYIYREMIMGTYPADAKDAGKPVKFSRAETLSQEKSYKGKDGKTRTLSLAQAIAAPMQNRAANTFWYGPIDASGTFGEVTKVIAYEAIDAKTGATLFASGKIGQGYQEVGFGKNELIHDAERAKLLEALTPQIAEYAGKKMWVKAMKRAYTVARMLDDIAALNDFRTLTMDDAGELKTVAEHLETFNEHIVSPSGKEGSKLSDVDSHEKAVNLGHRVKVLDDVGSKAGPIMDQAIKAGVGKNGDMRHNAKAHGLIEKVVKMLEHALAGDKAYAEAVEAALRRHGYLRDK
jgi:hypothetical protein